MSKLRYRMSTSLDGYTAGPNQSLENPLGEGGMRLHQWAFATKWFRTMYGDPSDGETGVNNDVLNETFENVGATIMGRNMFGPVRGPWTEPLWRGWWGETPPFHHPVFVLTHHARPPLEMAGGTTFHFVTEGIGSALAQARKAADGKDVTLGGANTIQQYLAAGLVDEFELNLVPIVLGAGERLLDNLGSSAPALKFELARTLVGAGGVTHLKYRVSR